MSHLGGSSISSRLQANNSIPSLPYLLIGEVPLVLGGRLGTKLRPSKLRVLLCSPTERKQAESHLRKVSPFKQVWSLEHFLVRNTVLLGCRKEGLDILHQQEGWTLQFKIVIISSWLG